MSTRSFRISRMLFLAIGALAFSHVVWARDAYFRSAQNQQLPGITSCASCHKTSNTRWSGIDSAFNAGGLQAVSQCLVNKTCGTNATGGTVSGTGVTLVSKVISGSVGAIDNGDAASNVYKIACPKKTVKLAISVNDQAPAADALVTIQALKQYSASIASDPIDADDTYGPAVELERGAGLYTILVSKQWSATAGPELFSAKLECIGKPKSIKFDDDGDDD